MEVVTLHFFMFHILIMERLATVKVDGKWSMPYQHCLVKLKLCGWGGNEKYIYIEGL